MLADDMLKFRDILDSEGIVFCYSGYMTEAVLTGIGSAIRNKLALEETDKKTARTVFSVFVEQVQNVIRYSAEKEGGLVANGAVELRYGVLTVGKKDDKFFVSCGNKIEMKDLDRLRTNLTTIKDMGKEDLKNLYKETLRGETPEGSKGAGVGFIDIARRASHGFDFGFTEIDDNHAYFALKAFI